MSRGVNRVVLSIVVCALILLLGFTGTAILASLKKPPAQAETPERQLRVDVIRVEPVSAPISIAGYGEVKALNSVAISPEVSGQIVEIHPNLEVGGLVPPGETLFVIDPRTYQARVDEGKAAVAQAQASLERLVKQQAHDTARLDTLSRTRDLARAEYERLAKLLEQDQVGTQTGVDNGEQAMNAAQDAYDLLNQTVALYPMRIEEARSALASAQAGLETAQLNVERTRVSVPFAARVKSVNLEKGQVVGPSGGGVSGTPVLELADDSVLELPVPLDSRDARKWLRFAEPPTGLDAAWFSSLEPVPCEIRWTEDPDAHCWEGTLNRVERFDPDTRTLTVAVRVEGPNAFSRDADALPLVEGMFCQVSIPGRVLDNAYRLPASAVSFEQTTYTAVDGRLRTVPVDVAYTGKDFVYVMGGLHPGALVVITRLTNPLENTLLDVRLNEEAARAEATPTAQETVS